MNVMNELYDAHHIIQGEFASKGKRMKVTKAVAVRNRENIVDKAGKLFRAHGYGGVGVAEVMRAAGLSHGGFYANFDSKEDLIVEASSRAMQSNIDYWREMRAGGAALRPRKMVERYLKEAYADAEGCVMAALGSEIARYGEKLRVPLTEQVKELVEALAVMMPATTGDCQRKRAMAAYAGMVGALVLARASCDDTFSQEIIQAVVDTI